MVTRGEGVGVEGRGGRGWGVVRDAALFEPKGYAYSFALRGVRIGEGFVNRC